MYSAIKMLAGWTNDPTKECTRLKWIITPKRLDDPSKVPWRASGRAGRRPRSPEPNFFASSRKARFLQADPQVILNSLYFLFSREDKSTLKWAAWGCCRGSQLTVTSFSVCWLVRGILSCQWGWESRWFYVYHELTQTWGPGDAIKVQIWSTPVSLEVLSLYISFLYFPFHDGSAEKCCQIGLSSVKWGWNLFPPCGKRLFLI